MAAGATSEVTSIQSDRFSQASDGVSGEAAKLADAGMTKARISANHMRCPSELELVGEFGHLDVAGPTTDFVAQHNSPPICTESCHDQEGLAISATSKRPHVMAFRRRAFRSMNSVDDRLISKQLHQLHHRVSSIGEQLGVDDCHEILLGIHPESASWPRRPS